MAPLAKSSKIALIHDAVFPVSRYGGTERVVWWLSKGLYELGYSVSIICRKGSYSPYAEIVPFDFSKPVENAFPKFSVYHHFVTPSNLPPRPYVVTIGGNGKVGERYLPNTVFVSKNHANRHKAQSFVHNGLDPSEYFYREQKEDYLVFLAKASWKVKNVKGAIRLSRLSKRPLHILGGTRHILRKWRGVTWEGMLGGVLKASLISRAKALLFPILWQEPFGLAVIEAMVSGTPVIATRRGSMPEIINDEVGRLCESEADFLDAIEMCSEISPSRCRQWVLDNFHYHGMAEKYLSNYAKVLDGEPLNLDSMVATDPPEEMHPLGSLPRLEPVPAL